MKEFLFEFYGYTVFFYSLALILSYVALAWLAEISILRSKRNFNATYTKRIMEKSPYTPGVSIIAPAFNEEKTIVDNVYSLLALDYPMVEVIIVNDGSRDQTWENLIVEFRTIV